MLMRTIKKWKKQTPTQLSSVVIKTAAGVKTRAYKISTSEKVMFTRYAYVDMSFLAMLAR